MAEPNNKADEKKLSGVLAWIEWAGNKLPDPAMLFVWALLIVLVLSALLAPIEWGYDDPRTKQPLAIKNMLASDNLVALLTTMVTNFVTFAPLGVVLVAMLGVGVAEHSGFVNAGLKGLLNITPRSLLTPMVILVGLLSHSAGDSGYVVVVPLAGVMFYAAGRHPVAGICAAFAAVSGGFSANPLPSPLDPLLQGFTEASAKLYQPDRAVNPLCNYYFTALSSFLIIAIGWFLTDRVIEPRLLRSNPVDGDVADMPKMETLSDTERRGLYASLGAIGLFAAALLLICLPADSPLRDSKGQLAHGDAPLMKGIVPLIAIFFLLPGLAYGYVTGSITSHRDVIKGMSKAMSTMGYYMVLAFFAAQFTWAFTGSNLGALLAVSGGNALYGLPGPVLITGIILLSTTVNLLIGSASAKWALLGPIFVPMMMSLGYSPELTQAAYRIGDSSTNIITPLMPYFPLIVLFAQKYVKNTGIGTLISLMIYYALAHLVFWTIFLVIYWQVLGIPLGVDAVYLHP